MTKLNRQHFYSGYVFVIVHVRETFYEQAFTKYHTRTNILVFKEKPYSLASFFSCRGWLVAQPRGVQLVDSGEEHYKVHTLKEQKHTLRIELSHHHMGQDSTFEMSCRYHVFSSVHHSREK